MPLCGQLSDMLNIGRRHNRVAIGSSPICNTSLPSMFKVFQPCDPFEIVGSIVGAIAVFVIHVRLAFGVFDKRACDQPVNEDFGAFAGSGYIPLRSDYAFPNMGSHVAVFCDRPFSNAARAAYAS